MKNIGPTSRRWLAEVEIYSIDDLRRVGAPLTYQLIKARHPERVSLNLLWALAGAIQDIDWRDLTAADKAALRQQLR